MMHRYMSALGNEVKTAIQLFKSLLTSIYYNHLASFKPRIVQMPVIDICNSRCVMCNIWMQKKDDKADYVSLANILAHPYFKKVKSVGLNGGEPTLRADIVHLAEAVMNAMPALKALNIFTNCIEADHVCAVIEQVHRIAQAHKIEFFAMLSLDGLGEVHDKIRGTPGNFERTSQVINFLKDRHIPFGFGSTISRDNIYEVDEVVDWVSQHSVKNFEVRMGVDIRRLYNKGFLRKQNLNQSEKFQVAQFFHELYVKTKNYFYFSLFRQLAFQEPRRAGCWWKHAGVTLDSRGDLSFCSVSSPIIGNAIGKDPREIVRANLDKLKEIEEKKCSSCMHDLNGPLPVPTALEHIRRHLSSLNSRLRKRWLLRQYATKPVPSPYFQSEHRPSLGAMKRVLVTGWWGTETQGDKAILGELLCFIHRACPQLESVSFTTYPDCDYVVRQTLDELLETGIIPKILLGDIIPIDSVGTPHVIQSFDGVMIGGGPIERLPELCLITSAFEHFRRLKKVTFPFGCGVDARLLNYEGVAKHLLANSSHVFLRDQMSAERSEKFLGLSSGCIPWATDPALAFIDRWRKKHPSVAPQEDKIVTLLRANTSEYADQLTEDILAKKNEEFASQLAKFVTDIGVRTELQCMNTVWLGTDDRRFNRKIAKKVGPSSRLVQEKRYLTLHELLTNISDANAILATRFHAHIFSTGMGIPFVSIDYTGKHNKIEAFIESLTIPIKRFVWDQVSSDDIVASVHDALARRDQLRQDLLYNSDRLIKRLAQVYQDQTGLGGWLE